jgi:hypothetical protein
MARIPGHLIRVIREIREPMSDSEVSPSVFFAADLAGQLEIDHLAVDVDGHAEA